MCKDKSLLVYFQLGLLFLHNMIKSEYNVIGVMSGTSLDGIDIAHITFTKKQDWQFKINHAITIDYPSEWKDILRNLIKQDHQQLREIDKSYTEFLASILTDYLRSHPELKVDFISSHGHTALHQPDQHMTYQIGNLATISKLTNCTVVCDFRVQDVNFGGQGAPLVPIGDKLLFSEFDYCINLGGFANISFENNGIRRAYDICPVNIVLNRYAERLGKEFDNKGALAKSGKCDNELLDKLNADNYFYLKSPKSLGLEWVEKNVFPILDQSHIKIEDILSTYVEHIAIQICRSITADSKVLLTGGGAFNTYLLERMNAMKEAKFIVPSTNIVNYKEALIFGLLGVLKMRDEINCLSSVTGAQYDHSSGVIY